MIWLRVATALSEIVVVILAQLAIGAALGQPILGTGESWIKFLSGTGAIVLTFLAGAELDPVVFSKNWKEASAIGLVGFLAPFFGCTAVAYYLLHWGPQRRNRINLFSSVERRQLGANVDLARV